MNYLLPYLGEQAIMELMSRADNNVQILALSGRFDTHTAEPVRDWLEQATVTQPANIVINLSNVDFLDSTALSTLVHGMKHSREKNGDLRICGMQPPVRIIFELTRLDRVFEIYPAEEEAVQAFAH
jgi:anti-sigma B factor antagonist